MSHQLPFRQIHLDFHTSPAIPDVGANFDADEFARVMKAAHVNSVTVFAKCHHGHLYYNTERPERHPSLKPDLNLLAEQVEALHREGIRAPIYISVQCDEYAANTHPEWIALNPDTSQVRRGGGKTFTAEWSEWQIVDMSSPYQEYLAEQTAEVLAMFHPVDGIFFDMCWDQPSVSKWAIEGMLKANLNPEDNQDRRQYAHQNALAYMERFYNLVKSANPSASVFFNSRGYSNFGQEYPFQTQAEIESLPTGGWGYMYFPNHVRYVRQFPRPYLGMTARFHKSWADFGGLKPYAALEYETSQMLAYGAQCSIGDQLHPRGELDQAAYELIEKIYARVEQREPWLQNAKLLTQVGVLKILLDYRNPQPHVSKIEAGITRLLTQLKIQFDTINTEMNFGQYELLILPDAVMVTTELAERLRVYLQNGGTVLASGMSGLSADGTELLLPELGIQVQGMSPYTTTYIRFDEAISRNVPPTDHVMYERGVRVTPSRDAVMLAGVVEPYFERSWNHFSSHAQTPGDQLSSWAAAVQHDRAAYISYPIFSAYAHHGNIPYRLLVGNILERLLPKPLVQVEAPSGLEVTVMQQERRTIVHLLYYIPERRTDNLDLVEDIVPLYRLPLSIKLPIKPNSVYLAPERTTLDFSYSDGYVSTIVPEVQGHAMVIFE